MPIPVTCDCGKALRLKDDLAGKRIRCPGCQEPLTVPAAEEALEEVLPAEDEPRIRSRRDDNDFDARRRRARLEDEDDRPRRRRDEDDDDRPRRRRDEDDDDEPRPRPKKRKLARSSGGGGGVNVGGVFGGIGLIVLGIGLFVGLLMAGWIWPYSLVIAVAGLILVIKSLMGGGDD